LDKLQIECQNESATELVTYTKFAAFCSTTDASKSQAIKENQDKANTFSAVITDKTTTYNQKTNEIADRKKKDQSLNDDLNAGKKQCIKDQARYDLANANLSTAIIGLKGAITRLGAATNIAAAPGLFLQLKPDVGVEHALLMAEAMGLVEEPETKQMLGFLQAPWNDDAGAEKNKSDYSFQSGGIVSTLDDLLKQFQTESDALNTEWVKTSAACDSMTTSKTAEILGNKAALDTASGDASTLKGSISDNNQNLLDTNKLINEDSKYLTELRATCAARAADFKQRSKARADEIDALSQAKQAIKDKVQTKDVAIKNRTQASLLQSEDDDSLEASLPDSLESVSFLQMGEDPDPGTELVQTESLSEAELAAQAAMRLSALRGLAKDGRRLKSVLLTGLVVRLRDSPLAAVKQLVQNLVENLIKESAADATKKGFCDAEMGKATKERARRMREAKKVNSKVQALEAKKVELTETLSVTGDLLVTLRAALAKATSMRTDESAQNAQTIQDAKDGSAAVKDAMTTLKKFYDKTARQATRYNNAGFLQVQDKADPTAAQGAYGGKQGAANGILAMMEVILSDFDRTMKDTKTREDKAREAFTKFKSDSNVDIKAKETTQTLAREDLATTNNGLTSGLAELKSTMDLLDGALKTLEALKPQCVDNVMSYEQQKAQRDQEIASLRTALCALDPLGTLPNCQGAK